MSLSDFTLIKAGKLIDGNGGSPIPNGAILLENELIRSSGPANAIQIPEGLEYKTLDYTGFTVLPGLIDSHVHLIGIGDGRAGDELTKLPDEILTLQAAKNAQAHLFTGVTTVRDCGAKNRTTFELRAAMEMGINYGPRLVLTGRPAAIVGGHLSYFGIEATGTDECRAVTRQLVKEGADFIKITASGGSTRTSIQEKPSFTTCELRSIAEEAHKFGKHTAAHCVNSQAIINCLDAGIDTIIHGRHVEPDGTKNYRPEITERLVKQGVFVNYNMGGANYKFKTLLNKQEELGLSFEETSLINDLRITREHDQNICSNMRSQGTTIVCGSDSAWGPYKMGQFFFEIEAHVEAGMSPMEAIVASTKDAARSCMVDDKVGTIQVGKVADLLVVNGDVSTNISHIKEVVDVFKDGVRIDRTASVTNHF